MNLEDIARQAGVSRSTVSRVINNEPYVSEKTRTRVLEVIEREKFSPNPAARALVKQRTNMIGVVIPQSVSVFFDDPSSYFPALLRGVAEVTHDRDYAMLLWLVDAGEEDRFYRRLRQNRMMEGIILASANNSDQWVSHVLSLGIHLVTVERHDQFLDRVSYVTVDNVDAAKRATQHLLQMGRKRIGHISADPKNTDGADRLLGYKLALEEAGIPVDPNLIANGNFTREAAYPAMQTLLGQGVDAVFVATDSMALAAIQAIEDAGLRIPDDIAVVGFDNLPVPVVERAGLTTVQQPVSEKGAQAAELLLDLIEGKVEPPQRRILSTELVIRRTCGATSQANGMK